MVHTFVVLDINNKIISYKQICSPDGISPEVGEEYTKFPIPFIEFIDITSIEYDSESGEFVNSETKIPIMFGNIYTSPITPQTVLDKSTETKVEFLYKAYNDIFYSTQSKPVVYVPEPVFYCEAQKVEQLLLMGEATPNFIRVPKMHTTKDVIFSDNNTIKDLASRYKTYTEFKFKLLSEYNSFLASNSIDDSKVTQLVLESADYL